jgi:hypothetical protein
MTLVEQWLEGTRRYLELGWVPGSEVVDHKLYRYSLLGALVESMRRVTKQQTEECYFRILSVTFDLSAGTTRLAVHPRLYGREGMQTLNVLRSFEEKATKAQCLDLVDTLLAEHRARRADPISWPG